MENGALKELVERYGKDIVSLYNGSLNGARTIVSVKPNFEHILIRNGSGIAGIIAANAVEHDLAERLKEESCISKYSHSVAYVPTPNGVLMCIKGSIDHQAYEKADNIRKRKGDINIGNRGKPIEEDLKTGYKYDKVEFR